MSTSGKLLPTELAALVHHVELNRAGWWDKAVHRLVLAAVWLSDKPPTVPEIQEVLKSEFRLTLNDAKISAATQALESQQILIRLDGSAFRIPDDKRAAFESEVAGAENATANARAHFGALAAELCPGIQPTNAWLTFESEFLAPLIREFGAKAYHIIAGQRMAADKRVVQHFLSHFDPIDHLALTELVSRFLDPKNSDVRTYVSRLLHATFCVNASGLPESVIQKLRASSGKAISFRLFVDTNFLFSILNLHENPSNSAASELQDLIATMKGGPKIALVVTPQTIDEAKHSIFLAKQQLAGIPITSNFTNAAMRVGFSGMAAKFFEERSRRHGRLTAGDWFDPYLNNFVSVARGKNVELYNENLDSYGTRQDVVDDILLVMKAQDRSKARRKSYEMIEHDMVLWHLVKDNRPAYIESPIDAQDWILTVDFRFIGFDDHKQKKLNSRVPICLHPASLIQLLQLWVPRTVEFEEAILGTLRLPFLFQEFDSEAERTSLRILNGIGRFENSENLSAEAIASVVLDEGLRARIKGEKDEDVEKTLIRDALVEEMKARSDAAAARAQQLSDELKRRDSELSTLNAETRNKEGALEQLRCRLTEEESRARQAELQLRAQGVEIDALKAKSEQREAVATRNRALRRYILLLGAVLAAAATSWWCAVLLPERALVIGVVTTRWLCAIVTFVGLHLIIECTEGRKVSMQRLWPLKQMRRFRVWLWIGVVTAVGGLGINLLSNKVQQKIDSQSVPPTSINSAPLEQQ